MPQNHSWHKAWVVSVDMGYGHQRAAHPLRHLAYDGIVNANSYNGIPAEDRNVWRNTRRFYEFVSRFKHVPVIGDDVFRLYDKLQTIPDYYPERDLSQPTMQVRQVLSLIRKRQWGKHLIMKLSKKPLPLVTTFFVPAFMAEYYKYPGEIYCIATDTDISRAWVTEFPSRTRIKYFAPTYRVADRLRLYGVKRQNIFLTGFPLPDENLGGPDLHIAKRDTAFRLVNLDPDRRYVMHHLEVIQAHLGRRRLPVQSLHPLMLTFPVGGAGAQRELAVIILNSLRQKIQQHHISYTMVAGIHNEVASYFKKAVRDAGLWSELDRHVHIMYAQTKDEYFTKFNHLLRTTDILWTKPSELSFYTALGLPLVIAPPIGSQEVYNRHWIESIGAGTPQEDPAYAHEWLFDWLKSGWLAEAAMEGFVEGPQLGTYNIERIVTEHGKGMHAIESTLLY
ncbi:MAG: hypothetical protein A3B30_02510 [Candidatus Komeilibacteria bacterium RIFCSPLOWO2_01_FULL_52_15]|uniref:DUF6938 domain-containing protein n=2 Tax=Candidatus Komeiliibacteriota TaxID=1817908 RepID=A0A1G2BQE9_9BACT|nr:MAG: hypothetical protein A2677_01500 [Candidatus Komeilibacteria bacterium RIFCSPHIGHO2_01_FULL_52_14]OGY91375.1 MAG: hypothetical protein A3B30_02510 [Candidatus Komeilibacteria bacterium RIFCSPLOWO2_01_FULL_52_15]